MPSYLTSSTLIDSVKRRENIPTSQLTFQDSDFLALANEEIMIGVLPSLMQFHEEFLVYKQQIPVLANVAEYAIPSRAIGSKIRTVFYQPQNGYLRELARIDPSDLMFFQNRVMGVIHNEFYIQNASIVLVQPSAFETGTLLISYYLRPNQLVTEDRVATISAIDLNSGQITVTSVPKVFSVTSMDLLETTGTHRTKAMDVLPLSVNSVTKTLTFTPSDIPTNLVVGDYIALSGECIIPQIPDDLHAFLAQRVACRCLEAQGATMELQMANIKLGEMEVKLGNLIDNRTEGNPKKVMNVRSLLRESRMRRRRML